MDFAGEINKILRAAETGANAALTSNDFAEAKRVLSDGIRDLRDLKRTATEEERAIRQSATDARLKNRGSGQTVGLFLGSKGRGALARGRAAAARSISEQQAKLLRPYPAIKSEIDRAIAALDRYKANVTAQAADAKEAGGPSPRPAVRAPTPTTPPPGGAPTPPPAWAPDPTGRFEHRWWDGTRWSEHVSTGGVASVDATPVYEN